MASKFWGAVQDWGLLKAALCERLLGVQGLLGNGGQVGEGSLVLVGNLSEDLAVELDAGELQAVHELAVGKVVHTGGCVDALNPKSADVALLVAAITVLILQGMLSLLLHSTEGAGTNAVVALSTLYEGLTLLATRHCALDTCHI